MLVEAGGGQPADVGSALQQQLEGDERKLGTILLEEGKAGTGGGQRGAAGRRQPKRSVADSAIRVDVDLLDTLMNLVGELVLARNQLVRARDPRPATPVIVRTAQRLNLITSELQEGIMKTRMQPIDHIWSKLPRVVRDLSQSLRQAGPAGHGGQGDRAGPQPAGGGQGPADPPGAQRGRPRHRGAGRADRGRQGPRRAR